MEFRLYQLRTGLRPDSRRFELSRYAILVADRSEAGQTYRRPASSC